MLTMQVGGCWPVRRKAWCSIWLEVIQRDSETFYPVLLFFFFFQESPFLRLDEPPWFFSVNSGLFTKQQNIGTEGDLLCYPHFLLQSSDTLGHTPHPVILLRQWANSLLCTQQFTRPDLLAGPCSALHQPYGFTLQRPPNSISECPL